MKKYIIFLLSLTMLPALAAASEDLRGLDIGGEITLINVADENTFGVGPVIRYENSFGDLSVYFKAKQIFNFDDPFLQVTYLEGKLAYNLPVGVPGNLSIVAWSVNEIARQGGNTASWGFFEPGVKYAQEFGFGTVFLMPGFSIWYESDTDARRNNLFLTIGYSNKRFGVEIKGWYNRDDSNIWMYELLLNYTTNLFFAELTANTNYSKEFDSFNLTPYVELFITDSISLWLEIGFENIGGPGGASVTPSIGAFYRF
ncbi:MAG: hypothetical protein FWC36_01330 [Spirochaetes bacterium]|nr:hypothetical protein [Spirochaetota bacterium]